MKESLNNTIVKTLVEIGLNSDNQLVVNHLKVEPIFAIGLCSIAQTFLATVNEGNFQSNILELIEKQSEDK